MVLDTPVFIILTPTHALID